MKTETETEKEKLERADLLVPRRLERGRILSVQSIAIILIEETLQMARCIGHGATTFSLLRVRLSIAKGG